MFGHEMLEGMFGSENAVSSEYAFYLGARLGGRISNMLVRQMVGKWWAQGDWDKLRSWLTQDQPGEEPLPPIKRD